VGAGNTGVAVQVANYTTGASIKNATVTVNGVTATYQANADDYEAYLTLEPSDMIAFNVVVNGHSYAQTTQQFGAYPVITAPASGSTWSNQFSNQVSWSGVSTGSGDTVALGVFDTAGNMAWPTSGAMEQVSFTQTGYPIPAGALSVGQRYVLVGRLSTAQSISDAAPGSQLIVGGFTYAGVTIDSANRVLDGITCVPGSGYLVPTRSRPLVVMGHYTDGTTADVTGQAAWSSSDGQLVSVNQFGVATGYSQGTASITAYVGGLQCQVAMNVVLAPAPLPPLPFLESSTFRIDYAHTGNATLGGVAAFPPSTTWFRTLDGLVSYPVVGGGLVFVTTDNDAVPGATSASLFALDLTTGATVWGPKAVPASSRLAHLAYANGRLFVLSDAGVLYALDGVTGTQAWSATLGANGFDGPPTVANGIVYAAGDTGLNAVDAATGTLLWQSPSSVSRLASPTVSNDAVYVASQCAASKFDPLTGLLLWRIPNGCSGGSAWTAAYTDYRLFFANFDAAGTYRVVDTQSATRVGSYPSVVTPAVNTILAAVVDGHGTISVVDRQTGTTRWSNGSLGAITADPLLVDGMTVTANASGDVYALDTVTGSVLWSGAAGASIRAANWTSAGPVPGIGVGNGWLLVPADHSLRAWKLVP
jgi:outer membrane protein assembly factor BamB